MVPPKSRTAAPEELRDSLNRVAVPAAPYWSIGLLAVDVLNHNAMVRRSPPVIPLNPEVYA